jgi:peptidoglycan/LPS O-acetylase OafA/YrhL
MRIAARRTRSWLLDTGMIADGRLAEIDGLRSVAMVMVVAFHCHILSFGWAGVWLFFVISGFVITRGFVLEAPNRTTIADRYLQFMTRRAVRIIPAYFACVLITCAVLAATGTTEPFRQLPFIVTFTENLQRMFGLADTGDSAFLFGALWSLSVEEQFYLVYPLLILSVSKSRLIKVGAVCLVAMPVARMVLAAMATEMGAGAASISHAIYFCSVLHCDAFMAGALLALLEPQLRANQWWLRAVTWMSAVAVAFWVCVAGIAGYGFEALSAFVIRANRPFVHTDISRVAWNLSEGAVYALIVLVSVCLMGAAIRRARWTRILASRPFVFAGQISYGCYLYHLLAIWLVSLAGMPLTHVNPTIWQLINFAMVMAVTIVFACASQRYVEEPVRLWARRRAMRPQLAYGTIAR